VERACENCGIPDDELVLVQRAYVFPDRPQEVERVEETPELWCLSCTSQYPHVASDG
jgi:hypothetical protein